MIDGPSLHTERLVLRPPVADDFPRFAETLAHPSARFVGGPMPELIAWRAFAAQAGTWALTGVGMFSVIERASGLWLGRVGPWTPPGWPGTEIGWTLHPDARGRGIGVEAATAAMDFACDAQGWTDVIHIIDPDNAASAALAARLGSARRGPVALPPPYQDDAVDLWGQTAAEWRARRR
jgi:RimJ/RimL family protein N-acetyltransferase